MVIRGGLNESMPWRIDQGSNIGVEELILIRNIRGEYRKKGLEDREGMVGEERRQEKRGIVLVNPRQIL